MKKNESEKKKELICKNILKKYGNVIAVDNISFYLEKCIEHQGFVNGYICLILAASAAHIL